MQKVSCTWISYFCSFSSNVSWMETLLRSKIGVFIRFIWPSPPGRCPIGFQVNSTGAFQLNKHISSIWIHICWNYLPYRKGLVQHWPFDCSLPYLSPYLFFYHNWLLQHPFCHRGPQYPIGFKYGIYPFTLFILLSADQHIS